MFRTEVHVAPSGLALSLQSKVVTLGSCFADVIGSKLKQNKLQTLVNPFGTIFNPLSAALLIEAATGKQYNFEEHLVQNNGIWYAYDLHSSLSSPSKDKLLQTINERLQQTQEALRKADLLIITLGTAVGYKLAGTGEVVANCHKLPAKNFIRLLLSTEEITTALDSMYKLLQAFNPKVKVLLTVSPVRHLKETIETNTVSKSILRVACHQLTTKYENVLYFPAYEIMLDDLRDYRFYKRDMIHPSEEAEDYIWQKFTSAYFSKEFGTFLQEWEKMQRALAHKAFHPASEAHQTFLKSTIKQLQQLQQKYNVDTTTEEAQLKSQIL
ncbi:GSCFA domain-containing protein [Pontibacter harenae]|uniref:GSCFA domain-containing protein n=1 Tax=Pontibacter harenae TaxID=2894083 RepID=UPI001E4599B6|nr:GSCFA domain-containing protein [Pontibacter harenae]MCC9166113.1 GSCFA domain-containing protein [Pontibacter harenae]